MFSDFVGYSLLLFSVAYSYFIFIVLIEVVEQQFENNSGEGGFSGWVGGTLKFLLFCQNVGLGDTARGRKIK